MEPEDFLMRGAHARVREGPGRQRFRPARRAGLSRRATGERSGADSRLRCGPAAAGVWSVPEARAAPVVWRPRSAEPYWCTAPLASVARFEAIANALRGEQHLGACGVLLQLISQLLHEHPQVVHFTDA